jgi:hypothetical protein
MTDMTTLSQAEVVQALRIQASHIQALHIQALHISARRGWMVIVSAFVILFVTFGTAYSFTAFFAPLQKTFGASRGDISLIFSINIPLVYLLGGISGPLADRFGARATCVFGVVVGGCGLIFAAEATALWQVYFGFGLCLGVGIGFAFVPSVGGRTKMVRDASRSRLRHRRVWHWVWHAAPADRGDTSHCVGRLARYLARLRIVDSRRGRDGRLLHQ